MLQQISAFTSTTMSTLYLYQPNPTKQILLYDLATSSSVLTFLKMNNIESFIKNFTNTEFMSENGRMPVVVERDSTKAGPMCGFNEVFWHVTRMLKHSPTLLELAYMDWVESNFLEAEMYICWCHKPVVSEYTQPRYTYDLPWPISSILFNRKKAQMQNSIGKKYRSFEDFLEKFNQFLSQLNKRIGNRPYCLSDTSPSCVDALIYGHTKAILNTNLNLPKLVDVVTRQRRIQSLTDLINRDYPS